MLCSCDYILVSTWSNSDTGSIGAQRRERDAVLAANTEEGYVLINSCLHCSQSLSSSLLLFRKESVCEQVVCEQVGAPSPGTLLHRLLYPPDMRASLLVTTFLVPPYSDYCS
jgi:hypothetical protein